MKNLFNSIQLTKPKKNVFDLSHDVKLSAKMGNLTPILVQECIPGDKFKLGCESLIRFAPLVAPVMHRMDVTMHYFFVPNRILWDNWEKFIVDANYPQSLPFFELSTTTVDSTGSYARFMDYMGIPPNNSTNIQRINLLPFAAYQAIYNEYYRDQNLINPIDYKLVDGNNTFIGDPYRLLTMRKRAWEHDYFTAALPFAQKGQAVDIPLGTIELNTDGISSSNEPVFRTPGGIVASGNVFNDGANERINSGAGTPMSYDPMGTLEVEPTSINDLRRAFRLQEWLEKNARGGARYIENILTHFGVRSSDKRLQRPEYITGIKSPVIISEILNTTGADGGLPQGNMSGHGMSVSTGKYGSYYCEEHGYIIGVMSVMPKTAYQQGIPRTYLKSDPLDFFWPSFANIGEQEVKVAELYAYTTASDDTFGYVPRYAEYKYNPSRVAGDFRTTLDYWHLGRIFADMPTLSKEFIECTPDDVERIFAVQDDTDNLYCHVYNKITAVRPMPKYGTPMF